MMLNFIRANCACIELPYPPVITSVELSSTTSNAVDITWTPGFNGNSPILRFTIDFRIIVVGMFAAVFIG